jgi:molybdenum cofactor synthesis domain-containing protein
MPIKIAILTISTRGSRGEREDVSGAVIKEIVQQIDGEVVDYQIIADDQKEIIWHLKRMAEAVKAELILTTGGTGLSPTDVTPEATLAVIERRVPGIEEVMRAAGLKYTPHAMLSRAVVGVYEKSLIINLPGSPKGVRENLEAILPVLPHAIEILQGKPVPDAEHSFQRKKSG